MPVTRPARARCLPPCCSKNCTTARMASRRPSPVWKSQTVTCSAAALTTRVICATCPAFTPSRRISLQQKGIIHERTRHHRRHRPHHLEKPRHHQARGGAHADRRAVRSAHPRRAVGQEGGVPGASRLRPHHTAARDQLSREHLGAAPTRRAARARGGGRGTYGTTQGPRLETAAEIDRMARDGGTMVGMTGMPEAALARELGLCYATCAVIVNKAAGRGDGPITMHDIELSVKKGMDNVRDLLEHVVPLLDS